MGHDPLTPAGAFAVARGASFAWRSRAAALLGLAIVVLTLSAVLAGASAVQIIALDVGAACLLLVAGRWGDAASARTKGGRSEAAVGKELGKLGPGFIVLHDVELGRGNADHLVAAPTGVFLVETKHRRYRPGDLGRAKGRAAEIGRKLGGVWVAGPTVRLELLARL